MKKSFKLFGIIALAALLGFAFTACGGGSGGGGSATPQTVTYVSKDNSQNKYTLEITENLDARAGYYRAAGYVPQNGDYFRFTVELYNDGNYSVALTFSGAISSATGVTDITIVIIVNGETLTITLRGGTEMTVITGDIKDSGGGKVVETPASLTPVTEGQEDVNHSLDGVWEIVDLNGWKIIISGNSGVWSAFAGSGGALFDDALTKNYLSVGTQYLRNIASTGNLTWSVDINAVEYYISTPNVAIGLKWENNRTITMSEDGQNITIDGLDWTRSSHSLNGVWELGDGTQNQLRFTFSGNSGFVSNLGDNTGLTQSAVDKGFLAVNTELLRNITSTGNLKWSGQELRIGNYPNEPDVAVSTAWINVTITMNENGKTIYIAATGSDDYETWTRKQ